MATTTTTAYRIHAIPVRVLDAVRAGAADAVGNPVERRTAGGGEPLRCCLRDAGPGEELIGRPRVLRAYDRHGRIHEATRIHDGTDPEAVIAAMLADPEVAQIHSRNVAWGCFMFAITRAG
jgi:Protein of unknown function (DUF1203)